MQNPNRIEVVTPARPGELPSIANALIPTPAGVVSAPPFNIPPQLVAVAGLLALALPAVAAFVPPPFGTLALILGFVAAFLAGAPLKVPTILEGRRIVGPTAVPILGTVATLAGTSAESLPEGLPRFAAQLLGLLCAFLAGKAFPNK